MTLARSWDDPNRCRTRWCPRLREGRGRPLCEPCYMDRQRGRVPQVPTDGRRFVPADQILKPPEYRHRPVDLEGQSPHFPEQEHNELRAIGPRHGSRRLHWYETDWIGLPV